MALYPNGYGGNPTGSSDMRTIEGVAARTTVARLHPEFWRRVRAMMEFAASRGVMLGVGTGWRVQPTNPDGSCKPGFACPGNSYHEGFMPGGRAKPDGVHDVNAMACDMVPEEAWVWMGANCHLFGLVDFSDVNSEPWHIQPVEIPRSRNNATAMPSLNVWNLPGTPGGDFTMTPADDLAIREIVREQTLANRRAQTVTAIGKFQALVNQQPSNAIYKAALAQEQARLAEYDAWLAVPGKINTIVASTDTVEATLARIEGKVGGVDLTVLKTELQAAVSSAVRQAVQESLADVNVNATISESDMDQIAAKAATATVAEIAS